MKQSTSTAYIIWNNMLVAEVDTHVKSGELVNFSSNKSFNTMRGYDVLVNARKGTISRAKKYAGIARKTLDLKYGLPVNEEDVYQNEFYLF